MTTIIAAKTDKGKIHFAWDTQTTSGGSPRKGAQKVFRNGPVIFGVSGNVRFSQILRYMDIPAREEHNPAYNTRRWITNKLAPAILKAVGEQEAAYKQDGETYQNGYAIIAVDGVVGYLGSDLSFVEDELGVYSVGSGSHFALGAFLAGADLEDSVRVAAHLDLYTNDDVKSASVKELLKK